MFSDYFIIAWKNLIHKKIRSWLTVIGILIGVVAVVSLISLGDGLRLAVTSQFGISSTEVISVQAGGLNYAGPPGSGTVKPLTKDDADAISRLATVERVVKRNIESLKVEFNDNLFFGYATNIPDGEDRKFVYEQIELEAERGRLLRDGDTKKVVLGYNYINDEKRFGKIVLPGDIILINGNKFDVIGVTKKKGSFIFDNIVYMNDNDLEELIDYGDEVDVIGVKIKSRELMDKAGNDIEKLLRKRRDVKEGEEDFEVSTPQAALATVNQVLQGVQIFILMIAFISILVGAIGIVNTMMTSVLERRKLIGIMKAIGARNIDIFFQFLVESGLMGLIGGIVGTSIGLAIGYVGTLKINDFVGAVVSPRINLLLIVFTLLGSFVIGSIAGILPAMRAARQKPVDVLRS